jgi:hypothetical protein
MLPERRANKIYTDFEPPCVTDFYHFVSANLDRKGLKGDLKDREHIGRLSDNRGKSRLRWDYSVGYIIGYGS